MPVVFASYDRLYSRAGNGRTATIRGAAPHQAARLRTRQTGQSTGHLAEVEDVELPVGECEVELDVADVGIPADDVWPGSRTVLRLGLRLKRQNAVGGLGVPGLLAYEAAVGRGPARREGVFVAAVGREQVRAHDLL